MRGVNKSRAGAAVLLAMCSNGTTQPPRLWLEQVRIEEKAPSAAPASVLEIKLLLEAGSAPVEVHTLDCVMPRLRDASGKDVAISDWRSFAGMAPPQLPPPPQPPLASGQRHVVCRYTVIRRAEGGYHLMAPNGGADFPAGTYVITAKLDLIPTTRELWTARFRAANRPTRQPNGRKVAADPEKEAQRYAAHWGTVDTFFKGPLETPELTFTLR